MSNSQFTILQMAEAFGALPDVIAELLHSAGYSPCDYGSDGCTAHYDAAAAGFVAERLPAQQALSAVEQISVLAAEQKQLFRAKLIPADSTIRAEL